MEGSIRSGGVLKKKSSSGCLIIKKKVENRNSGVGGLIINSKEKKRPRLVVSDSSASDEDESLEFMRRKVNDKRLHNGSMGYKRSDLENREYDRNNIGINISGERKRSRIDLFEFDEYDEFDGKRMRNEYVEDRFNMVVRSGSENSKDFGVGSSHRNLAMDKRKQGSYFDGSRSGRTNPGEYVGMRNKGFELEEDEEDMPNSLLSLKYQEKADEPIRLQGKNGVLKVMVNKKKRMDLHSHHKKYDPREIEERAGSRSEDVLKKELSPPLPVYPSSSDLKTEKTIGKEKKGVKLEKVKPVLGKGIRARESEISTMSKGIKERELETDGTDTALKLAPPGLQACSSKKGVKKEEERKPSENVTPLKGKEVKEGKAKRGGSTEKQMLREKIRGMLLDAGWTIDYRPRRNRDYLDAVYINTNGTAYWSIIKAYDALKKQLEEDIAKTRLDVGPPSFAPLAEDLINKLTRQTKKKIEEEMKRKRKEDGVTKRAKRPTVRDSGDSSDSDQNEERISSYTKQNNKSRKGKSLEADQESDDDLSDDSPKRKPRKFKVEKPSSASNSNVLQGRTSKVIGRCTLLVRGSDKGENSESDGYVPYSGKRTVLAWLIDSGTAQLSEKVQYMNRRRTRAMLEGWITRDGIHCGCCSKILTVSKFELHAGSKLRQPFQNIFLESGASLLQCQIDAWNRQGESVRRDFHTVDVDGDDPDDDTCGICGDGGALICCDSCPSTFHQICLEIQLYDHLQKILGVKHELDAGFSWSLIQRADVSDTSHRGFPQRVECNSKLAVALSVMDECFLPIIDRRSGINIIHNVVYNCGIQGTRLAEMPFIGTRETYRRQGMCRRLLSAIETELRTLKVEKLIIPAISEHRNTWTTVFGFHQLENVLKKEIKSMNMLVFPGTDMLQKHLANQEISDGIKQLSQSNTKQPQLPVLVEKSDIDSSTEHVKQTTNDSKVYHERNTNDEVNDLNSGSPAHPSNDNSADSASDSICESDTLLSKKGSIVPIEAEDKQNQKPLALDNAECVTNGSIESPPGSVFETSTHSTTGKVNGEQLIDTFPTRVVIEDQRTLPKVAIIDSSTLNDVDDNYTTVGKAFFTKTNVEVSVVQLAVGSTFPDGGESIVTRNADIDHKAAVQLQNDLFVPGVVNPAETDKRSGLESKTPLVIDGNVASKISETLARNVAPAENHTESNDKC
ncbi:hypothetical protein DH2020_049042 [Rehmannia glutinosa]|uniref:Zinc finger PHD-type domain-containing protein n=1 Tax=Rehmannia glutinosa TaxID=99300 RepID=A0ABR0U3T6_REHGL